MANEIISSSLVLHNTEGHPMFINPDIAWYITDIIIECTALVVGVDHSLPSALEVYVFSRERDTGEALLLDKISAQQWEHKEVVKLLDNATFVVMWDDSGEFGSTYLTKDTFRKSETSAGLEILTQFEQEFLIKGNKPVFKLRMKFKLSIAPTATIIEQLDMDTQYMTSLAIPSRDPPDLFVLPLLWKTQEHFTSFSDEEISSMLSTVGQLLQKDFPANCNPANISRSIACYEKLIELTPEGHACLPYWLGHLGVLLYMYFGETGNFFDISKCISSTQKAIHLTPQGCEATCSWLSTLGVALNFRFGSTGDISDLSEAITCAQEAVDLTSQSDPMMYLYLGNLGILFAIRFNQISDLSDLSQTISCLQKAVHSSPPGHSQLILAHWLYNLGLSLSCHYKNTHNLSDISEAILCCQKAIVLTSLDNAHLPDQLCNLGDLLASRFTHTKYLSDISEAILCYQKAVNLTSLDDAKMLNQLNILGNLYVDCFQLTGKLSDISEAISCYQKAISLTSPGDEHMHIRLANLGYSLFLRFKHTTDLSDISEAISYCQKAVYLTPLGHANMLHRLTRLGDSHIGRFELTHDVSDISEAILYHQTSVCLTPPGDETMHTAMRALGQLLKSRFYYTHDLLDITQAIYWQQRIVDLISDRDAEMSKEVWCLGALLKLRFDESGELSDINQAILCHREAMHLIPSGHLGKSGYLNSLGAALASRSQVTGNLPDISEAIICHQKAIDLHSDGHENLAILLCNLGNVMGMHFEHTGNLLDISQAISYHQKALDLADQNGEDFPHYLSSHGLSFLHRFNVTGDLSDIHEAISYHRKAVLLTHASHLRSRYYLNLLGSCLSLRFDYFGNLSDLSEAILYQQKVVDATPHGHVSLPHGLARLGHLLWARFKHAREAGTASDAIHAMKCYQTSLYLTPWGDACMHRHLNNAAVAWKELFKLINHTDFSLPISYLQIAIDLTPHDHHAMPSLLSNLGGSLHSQFRRTGKLSDILQAISFYQKATDLTPEGHIHMPSRLLGLGNALADYFTCTNNHIDQDKAILNYSLAATYSSGHPDVKLSAAKKWAIACDVIDPPQSLKAWDTAIHLVSKCVGLEHTIQNRHKNLCGYNISSISTEAVASAIKHGQFKLALEWLEQSRCFVWSQLNNLRTSLEALKICNPIIAAEFSRVSQALENAGFKMEFVMPPCELIMQKKISLQDEAIAHIKLAKKWDQLLIEIRALPGFDDFLQPPLYSNLVAHLPSSGPVVMINVHKTRCDALVLKLGWNEPLHISLPCLSYAEAAKLHSLLKTTLSSYQIRMHEAEPEVTDTRGIDHESAEKDGGVMKHILYKLWNLIVKPILDGMGYIKPLTDLERIWWCATGPLAFLPIHAAGIYSKTTAQAVSSTTIPSMLSYYAISSYIPTIWALTERVIGFQQVDEKKASLFMVSQPDTPNLPPIPGTSKEVHIVEQQLQGHNIQVLCLEGEFAIVEQGLANMESYSCIHLACHATQDVYKPLKSGFVLHDGCLELSSIIKKHLVGADLAFLSACQTSKGDETLSEEAVHLAAGMLTAGYRGVVATMWSIKDQYASQIAKDFYAKLNSSEGGLGGKHAAHALHYAMQKLQNELDDSEMSLLIWIPYIHFGL